ncbi:MAG: hypothetical protein EBT80_06585 [Chitinophagales bacterium]|nr:hypothetical protein [Chitinophagales bacterium]
MKTVAIFLLLTFSGTILLPVAMSLTQQNQISLFIVDEEKSDNAGQANEIKEQKKDYGSYFLMTPPSAANTSLRLLGDGRSCLLPPSPYLEYVAPPPNVC